MNRYLKALELRYPADHCGRDARQAAALYLHLLQSKYRLATGHIGKVVLRQGLVATEEPFPGVCDHSHPLRHLDSAANASDGDAGKRLIDEIGDALLSLAVSKGWNPGPLHALRDEVVRRGYRFEGSSGRALKNPSGTMTATAAWHTDQYLHIGIRVSDAKAATTRFITATRIGIALGLFETLLGPVQWVDDRQVRLFQRNKRDYWQIDTYSADARFHFPRAESGDAHGQYELARMYLDGWIVEQDRALARHWLQQSAAQGLARAQKLLQRLDAGEDLADPIKNSLR